MTKQDIKDLCEHDSQLQWWAMVLFAEIVEFYESVQHQASYKMGPVEYKMLADRLGHKVEEFPKIILQHRIEIARQKLKELTNATTRSPENQLDLTGDRPSTEE